MMQPPEANCKYSRASLEGIAVLALVNEPPYVLTCAELAFEKLRKGNVAIAERALEELQYWCHRAHIREMCTLFDNSS